MAFYFTLSCLRSCVLLGCNCMYVYLATNKEYSIRQILDASKLSKTTFYRYLNKRNA